MKKIFYEKVGRKYVPVREYDSELVDSLPFGNHLIMCYPNGKSRRYNIDPNYAALIAAGRIAEDVIVKTILKASELKPSKKPYTKEQLDAWENLRIAYKEELSVLYGSSIQECVDAGMKAMMHEAQKLLDNPTIKNAFEQFLLLCELTKNDKT